MGGSAPLSSPHCPHPIRVARDIAADSSSRYQRVRYAQILGEDTRNRWHRARPSDRGSAVELPRPEWLLDFDAERHAYEVFSGMRAKLEREGYTRPVLP